MSRRRMRRVQPTTDSRSPEQRLEAWVREPNVDRSHRIFRRIRDDLIAQPEAVRDWIAGAGTLADRLIISYDALLYLAEIFLESWTERDAATDPELCRISAEMVAIERQHGLGEDDDWLVHAAPAEWQALNEAWNARALALDVARLREYGYREIAELWETKPGEFERRANKGRIELWGPDEEVDGWVEGALGE